MIAVPITFDGQLLGVLYGANRHEVEYGDRITLALEHIAARTAAAQVVAERARHAAEVAVHEERRRMALELHDTVGAMLFTLGAGIRRLGAEAQLDDQTRARVSAIEQQAAEAAVALRGSLRVLSAAPEQVALGVVLREHCTAFQARTGTTARMITLTELPALPPWRVKALADAAREALLNAEKHAQAQSVVVTAFAQLDGVAVTISDDGIGFDASCPLPVGLGLTSMSDRLARVGGTATITRNDDGGLTVQAWVPASSSPTITPSSSTASPWPCRAPPGSRSPGTRAPATRPSRPSRGCAPTWSCSTSACPTCSDPRRYTHSSPSTPR
jgi:signal transduction histidine kinase